MAFGVAYTTQEAVVILWRNSGGTGSNTYVVVMARQNDEVRNIGTALIGDRVKLRSGKIADGHIIIEVLQAGENDAMCCPTMFGVIVKSGVSALELGSDLINCFHLDSIFEFNPGNHLRQVAEAA